MTVTVVCGMQIGDEGKGKIVDLLSEQYDIVARGQGGNNAGHTVIIDGVKHVLHMIPVGVLRGKHVVIGSGCVVDPFSLMQEVKELNDKGIVLHHKIKLSAKAHLILPYHIEADKISEELRGANKLGTTCKGIGPTYIDKYARAGIRAEVLTDNDMLKEVTKKLNAQDKNALIALAGETPISSYVCNTEEYVHQALAIRRDVLAEGAQGFQLDIDHGAYPNVTSSSCTASGICAGLGIGPASVKRVVGVMKAYTTRVGRGPFPTRFDADFEEQFRKLGKEFGATTGRPRKCGWLDMVALRSAVMINGITDIAIMKLDMLFGLPQIKVCVAYRLSNGDTTEILPVSTQTQETSEPIYRTMPGFEDVNGALNFISMIEDKLRTSVGSSAIRIAYASVGPDRNETYMHDSGELRHVSKCLGSYSCQ